MIVGRGGRGKNTNRAPNKPEWKGGVMGGNGGMIAFKKNLLISKNGSSGVSQINEIVFPITMLVLLVCMSVIFKV